MRVIITGGTGLIGRALAASLAADNHEVIALSRHPEKVTDLPAGVRVEKWDAATHEGWGHWVEGAEAIVNLAGENLGSWLWTRERKRAIMESRLAAGQAVADAVEFAREKPKVVIQASAVGYYGPRGSEEITEETEPGSDFMAEVCVAWERSSAKVGVWQVRRAIIRSAIVLAPGALILKRLMLPFRFFVGGPLGSGRQGLPWIHIDDEIAAIRFLMENEKAKGPFNLAAPNPPTNAQFAKTLGKVMGRPSFIPAPAFVLRLALGEMSATVLDGQRAVPQRLLELGFQFRFPDLEGALRDVLQRRP